MSSRDRLSSAELPAEGCLPLETSKKLFLRNLVVFFLYRGPRRGSVYILWDGSGVGPTIGEDSMSDPKPNMIASFEQACDPAFVGVGRDDQSRM